jgi:hypothetical protein
MAETQVKTPTNALKDDLNLESDVLTLSLSCMLYPVE